MKSLSTKLDICKIQWIKLNCVTSIRIVDCSRVDFDSDYLTIFFGGINEFRCKIKVKEWQY